MKKRADGRYQQNITITDPSTGKSKRKTFYGTTQAAVRRAVLEYTGEQEKGPTLKSVCDEWQAAKGDSVRYNTQVCYKKPIEDVLEEFGDQRIREITTIQIEDWLEGYKRKGFARQTVYVRKVVLNQICKYALRHRYIESNPAEAAELPTGLKKKKVECPPEAVLSAIDALDPQGFNLLPIFLYYTGCRRAEALALRWEDIDFARRIIRIDKEVEYHGNKPIVVDHSKTEAGCREIIIRKKLLEILPRGRKGIMFPGKSGDIMSKGELTEWWNRLKLDATPHQLRHAYTTELFEAEVPALVAITQTGHKDVRTMEGIYTHIRQSQKDKAVALLDAYDSEDEGEVKS